MDKAVLIIGAEPDYIDFDAPDAPKGVTAESIREGLEMSRDRLIAVGHGAHILWTTDSRSIEREAREALAERRYASL